MSYIKDRIFVFDIETVIDIESSGSFLGLNSEACKSEITEKIKQYHIDSSFSGSDFVKPPFHKIVAISYLDATIYADNEGKERYKIFNIKSCILTMQVYLTCIISSKEVALLWKTEEVTPNKITDTKSGHLV